MLNIKKGDILKDKHETQSVKVIAICDEIYAISLYNDYDSFGCWYSEKELKQNFILPEELVWVPKMNENYYTLVLYLPKIGGVMPTSWQGDRYDLHRLKYNMVFRTKEEAEKAYDEVLLKLSK